MNKFVKTPASSATLVDAHDRLVFDKVSIRLADKELVSIDTCVEPGEVLTLMGPSGSGKSSLLAYIAGFLEPAFTAAGSVRLGETDLIALPPAERRVGLLFQDALLFPHMSVGGNLQFALPAKLRGRDRRRAAADQALIDAGLDPDMFNRDPATLSGGQRARIALMRILLSEPRALLLDEPFSKLDSNLRQQIRELVFSQAEKRKLPVLLVTHDRDDAVAAGGRQIVLGSGIDGSSS